MSQPASSDQGDGAYSVEAHSLQFYKVLDTELAKKDLTAYPMKDELFHRIVTFVRLFRGGMSIVKLKNVRNFGQAYVWAEKYDLVTFGETETLVYKEPPDETGQLPAYDTLKQVSRYSTCFSHIRDVHIENNCHKKSRKLFTACQATFGPSIPNWATAALVDTCAVCITKQPRRKPKAGFQPIITRGFGARGQVDLIDMQSMPDGPFNWIINYTDHGIKFVSLGALCKKECRGVAWFLYNLFCAIGPPAILQSDNGREFNGMALGGRARKSEMSDDVRRHCGTLIY